MSALKRSKALPALLGTLVWAYSWAMPFMFMERGEVIASGQIRSPEEMIDPHFTGKNCDVCHEGEPHQGDEDLRLKFGGDDVALCNSCHQAEHLRGDLHPVNIVPPPPGGAVNLPSELPLYDGKLTCRTCHDVFLQCRLDPAVQFENINFLRGAPYVRPLDLCFRCHNREFYTKINPHEQWDAAGNMLKASCLYCHQSVPDPDYVRSIEEVSFIVDPFILCTGCHGEEERLHPAKANHSADPSQEMLAALSSTERKSVISMPLFNGTIFCGTCHNPHDRGIIKREAAARAADEKLRLRLAPSYELCVACHNEKEDLPERETDIVIQDKDLIIADSGGDMPPYHKSFLEKKCRACHAITRENPEPPVVYKMCFLADCHDTSLIAGTFKHSDAQRGNCLLCHTQHGSQYEAHSVSAQHKLCKACHPLIKQGQGSESEGKEQGEDFHDYYLELYRKILPDQEMSCLYCHGEDHSTVVYGKGIMSCYQCHGYIRELIMNRPGKPEDVHETFIGFAGNKCTFCHNPHSGAFPYLLKEEPELYEKNGNNS